MKNRLRRVLRAARKSVVLVLLALIAASGLVFGILQRRENIKLNSALAASNSKLSESAAALLRVQDRYDSLSDESRGDSVWLLNLGGAAATTMQIDGAARQYVFTGRPVSTTLLSQYKAMSVLVEKTAPDKYKDVASDYAVNMRDIGEAAYYLGRSEYGYDTVSGRIRRDMNNTATAIEKIAGIVHSGTTFQKYNFNNGNVPDVSDAQPAGGE